MLDLCVADSMNLIFKYSQSDENEILTISQWVGQPSHNFGCTFSSFGDALSETGQAELFVVFHMQPHR